MNLLKTHRATDVVMHLNTITYIQDDDDYFEMSKSNKVARILTS